MILLADENNVLGIISVSDTLKEESVKAIKELHPHEKLKVLMRTGDNIQSTNAIAREVNINEVIAKVQSGGKAEQIKRLQKNNDLMGMNNDLVGMVDDGINDAPTLTQAANAVLTCV